MFINKSKLLYYFQLVFLISTYVTCSYTKNKELNEYAEVGLNVTEAVKKDLKEYAGGYVEGNVIDNKNNEQLINVPEENTFSINFGTKDIARKIIIEWLRRGLRIFGGCVFADCRDQSNSTKNTNSNKVVISGNSGGVFSGHIG